MPEFYQRWTMTLQAALLAGRRNASTVSSVDFDNAILRAVAGVEKKRSILMGKEKSMVAKHEVCTWWRFLVWPSEDMAELSGALTCSCANRLAMPW